MRIMVIVKSTPEHESGTVPSTDQLAAMTRYNAELINAGIMLAGEGLRPSSSGARVRFTDGQPEIAKGPFRADAGLVAGYWLWRVRSWDEAMEWIKRCPLRAGSEVELREVFETEHFGDNLTPELRAHGEQLRTKAASLSGA